jgi:hypothetical protein
VLEKTYPFRTHGPPLPVFVENCELVGQAHETWEKTPVVVQWILAETLTGKEIESGMFSPLPELNVAPV